MAAARLKASEGVVEDDLDRRHTLGGPPRGRSATADKLGELRVQPGLQAVEEPYGEAAAFACCETQPHVGADAELDATADHFAVATGMRRAGAPRDQRVVGCGDTGVRSLAEDGGLEQRRHRSVAVHEFRALLPARMRAAALVAFPIHDATTLT